MAHPRARGRHRRGRGRSRRRGLSLRRGLGGGASGHHGGSRRADSGDLAGRLDADAASAGGRPAGRHPGDSRGPARRPARRSPRHAARGPDGAGPAARPAEDGRRRAADLGAIGIGIRRRRPGGSGAAGSRCRAARHRPRPPAGRVRAVRRHAVRRAARASTGRRDHADHRSRRRPPALDLRILAAASRPAARRRELRRSGLADRLRPGPHGGHLRQHTGRHAAGRRRRHRRHRWRHRYRRLRAVGHRRDARGARTPAGATAGTAVPRRHPRRRIRLAMGDRHRRGTAGLDRRTETSLLRDAHRRPRALRSGAELHRPAAPPSGRQRRHRAGGGGRDLEQSPADDRPAAVRADARPRPRRFPSARRSVPHRAVADRWPAALRLARAGRPPHARPRHRHDGPRPPRLRERRYRERSRSGPSTHPTWLPARRSTRSGSP